MEAILTMLSEVGKETTDLILPLVGRFLSNYQNSYKAARLRISGDTYHLEKIARYKMQIAEQQYFQTSLQYLKRKGFVIGKRQGRSSFWSLTEKGYTHLEEIRMRHIPYDKEITDKIFILSYDIPETNRRDRGWIRGVLGFLDFSMVHKSVWIGKHKIPEGFLLDLKRRGVFKYVHIFEVGQRGTLAKLQ